VERVKRIVFVPCASEPEVGVAFTPWPGEVFGDSVSIRYIPMRSRYWLLEYTYTPDRGRSVTLYGRVARERVSERFGIDIPGSARNRRHAVMILTRFVDELQRHHPDAEYVDYCSSRPVYRRA